jgi:hypothetical protein
MSDMPERFPTQRGPLIRILSGQGIELNATEAADILAGVADNTLVDAVRHKCRLCHMMRVTIHGICTSCGLDLGTQVQKSLGVLDVEAELEARTHA